MRDETIPKFRPGQTQLSARHLNQLVASARSVFNAEPPLTFAFTPSSFVLSVDTESELLHKWWLGRIDSSTESDYSDCRYWVQKAKVSSRGTPLATADVTWPNSDVYTVTNLPEWRDNSHALSDGRRVIVFTATDASSPPKNVYFMSESPPAQGQFLGCLVTNDGGDVGTASDQCSLTYRYTNLASDLVYGTGTTPLKARPQTGMMSDSGPESYGVAFRRGSDVLLWDANEYILTSDCG